jgi:flavodoxin
MKLAVGIVYYSRNNNTRTAALHLADKKSAEIIELVELNDRKGLFGLMKSMLSASKGQVPKLQGDPWKTFKRLDTVYLMAPIWGGDIAPPMVSFMQSADFSGKEAVAVTFQADRKGEGSSKVHDKIKRQVLESGGSFIKGHALHGAFPGKYAGKDYIESQIDKII